MGTIALGLARRYYKADKAMHLPARIKPPGMIKKKKEPLQTM
jgi:hypothetical protein